MWTLRIALFLWETGAQLRKALVQLAAIALGAALIVAAVAIAVRFPRWGWIFGPAILIAIGIAAWLESWSHGHQYYLEFPRCTHTVTTLAGSVLRCSMPAGHNSDCAVSWSDLEKDHIEAERFYFAAMSSAGYCKPPF